MKLSARQDNGRSRLATILAHFIFIVIIFILPDLVWTIARPDRPAFAFYPGFYVKTLIFIAVFYINYFVIVDRTLSSDGRRRIPASFSGISFS